MLKKIIKPFLKQGIGGLPPIKYLCRSFIFVFNPFNIDGSKIYLPLDEIQFLITGYDVEKREMLKKIVKEGDVIVDLGAHIGYFTTLFAKLVGKTGKVYAFEPEESNFKLLEKNKKINGYDNIILEKKAVSSETGKTKIYSWQGSRYYRTYGEKSNIVCEVEKVKLDDYFKHYNGKINIIKINVVGSEGAAIQGMTELLKNNPNIKLFIEYSPKRIKEMGGDPIDCLNILDRLGFKIWLIKEKLEPVNKIKTLVEDDATKELFCKK